MNWAYVAGLFDGEGTTEFPMGKNIKAQLKIAQSGNIGFRVLSEIAEWMTSQGIKCRVVDNGDYSPTLSKQPAWRLRIWNRKSVMIAAKKLMPHLHIKKPAVQDILRFFVMYPDMRGYRHGHV